MVTTSFTLAAILYYFDENRAAQRKLDAYLNGQMSPSEIGLFYERYVGYIYENSGFDVDYNGATSGYKDMGRDLIARKGRSIHIIQTKCWAKNKTIHEKHIFQLFGSTAHYRMQNDFSDSFTIQPVFCTSAKYSDVAHQVADVLGVELGWVKLDRTYPLIKCNVNLKGERIFHLPFDRYYDKIKIRPKNENCYVHTVKEAVEKGFRRAKV